MRLTRLDIVVDIFILLAIALMIPMPWLLSFGQVTGSHHQGTLYCASIAELREPPPEPTSITTLWRASLSVVPERQSSRQELTKIPRPVRCVLYTKLVEEVHVPTGIRQLFQTLS